MQQPIEGQGFSRVPLSSVRGESSSFIIGLQIRCDSGLTSHDAGLTGNSPSGIEPAPNSKECALNHMTMRPRYLLIGQFLKEFSGGTLIVEIVDSIHF